MNNKFFGEFLVEKKLINSSGLIEALLHQIEDLPSIPRIMKDEKILNDEQIIQVLVCQQKNHCEFLRACEMMGLIDDKIISQLESVFKAKRKPLGEILVSLNMIDIKNLTKALDEFLSTAQAPSAVVEKFPETLIESSSKQSQLDDFIEFQPALLMELDEAFDDRKRKVIKTALVLIKENTQNDPASAMKLFGDISKILKSIISLSEIIGLSNLNELLVFLDKKISTIIQTVKTDGEFNPKIDYFSLMNESIDLCWEFRNSIISNCSEEKFIKDRLTDINNIKQKLL
jgi:hypothetical protein